MNSHLVPQFIINRYKDNSLEGSFSGFSMFADISGFTDMTEELMKHGKEGAEVLSQIINDIFTPSIYSIYDHGGFIASFEGDGFTSIFQDDGPEYPLKSASLIYDLFIKTPSYNTKFGSFKLSVKIGLSYGNIDYRIIDTDLINIWFFKGEAICNCKYSENLAKRMTVIADRNFMDMISKEIAYKKIDQDHFQLIFQEQGQIKVKKYEMKLPCNKFNIERFIIRSILELKEKGEFREVISCFIGFSENSEYIQNLRKIIKLCSLYGGYINSINFDHKGGIIYILFGAPYGFEKLNQRACDFILSLRSIQGFSFRAGLESGIAFTGFIGSNLRNSYTALGNVVNLSSRLMEYAPWHQILSGPLLSKSLIGIYNLNKPNICLLKGFREKIEAYELVSKIAVASASKNFKQVIEREADKEKFLGIISDFNTKRKGRIALIDGEAGIGKTFFINNIIDSIEADKYNFFFLYCDDILRKAFNPFINFFKAYFLQKELNRANDNKEFFLNKYSEIIDNTKDDIIKEELIRTRSFIAGFIEIDLDEMLYKKLDAKSRYENTIYAVKNFFISQCRDRPLFIIIEDFHNIDEDSINLIKNLCYNIHEFPIFILFVSRVMDDGSPNNIMKIKDLSIERIILKSFTREMIHKLIMNNPHCKRAQIPEETLELIYDKSGGNPFFAEQIFAYLIESKMLDDDYNITLNTVALPSRINQLIISRIDRLSSNLREIIKTASVLGNEFSLEVLQRLYHDPDNIHYRYDHHLLEYIEEGCLEKIWYNISDSRYRFMHTLLRDAVYEMQLRDDLRRLHDIAGQSIENLNKDNLQKYYQDLAMHYYIAENTSKALFYLEKSGEQSQRKYENFNALDLYNKYIDLIEKNQCENIGGMVYLKKGMLCELMGRWNEALMSYDKALNISHNINDRSLEIDTMNQKAFLLLNRGDIDKAFEITMKALRFSKEMKYSKALCKGFNCLGNIHIIRNNYDKAMEFFEKELSICIETGDKEGIARSMGRIANVYTDKCDYIKAMEYFLTNLELCREIGDKQGTAIAYGNIGTVYWFMGDYSNSLKYYQKVLNTSREIGDKNMISTSLGNIGLIYINQGDLEKAMLFYQDKMKICHDIGNKRGIASAQSNIGSIYSYQGKFHKALKCHKKKLEICQEIGDRRGKSSALGNIGNVFRDQGKLKSALRFYKEKIDLCEEIGDKWGITITLIHLGDIYKQMGDYPLSMENYDRGEAIARELNSRDKLCVCLEAKAGLLFLMEREIDAKAKAMEALEIAKEIKRKDLINNSKILIYRLDKDKEKLLNLLLDETLSKENIGEINYEIWKITKDRLFKDTALKIFSEIYRKLPKYTIKSKIDELRKT